MAEPELKKIYGRILVSLAVSAEAHEFEVSERIEQIGSDEFWENVTRRLEALLNFRGRGPE